jgi:hypothetical protein
LADFFSFFSHSDICGIPKREIATRGIQQQNNFPDLNSSTDKIRTTTTMSRGTRQQQSQHNNNSGSGSSASQQSVQNSNNNTNIRRGNKTLGWYLGELVPSQSGGGNGNADEANNGMHFRICF